MSADGNWNVVLKTPMGDRKISVYAPTTQRVSAEPLRELLKYLPGKVAQCRVFAMTPEHDQLLAQALVKALNEDGPAIPTNV